jgi:diguanylate cyclase (GGDEF)-like protein
MTVQDRELVYPAKLQPALDSRLARMRREAGWLMIRSWRLVTSDGLIGLVRGAWRWVSRMALRGWGMRRLSLQIRRAQRPGSPNLLVAFVDVDGLSRVDEALGRPAAARIVRKVGRHIRAELGSRALIFRYGGDEYVCVLSTSSISELAEDLARARQKLLRKCGRAFTAGITEFRPQDTAYTVVKRAELHMFGAKESPSVTVTSSLLPVSREAATG